MFCPVKGAKRRRSKVTNEAHRIRSVVHREEVEEFIDQTELNGRGRWRGGLIAKEVDGQTVDMDWMTDWRDGQFL